MPNPKKLGLLLGVCLMFGLCNEAFAGDPCAPDSTTPTPCPMKRLPSPHVRLSTGPGTLVGPDGQTYLLPLGTHILDGTTFDKLDQDTRDLQTKVVRLTAENDSFKSSMGGPGWGTVLIVALGAAALGFTVEHFVQ